MRIAVKLGGVVVKNSKLKREHILVRTFSVISSLAPANITSRKLLLLIFAGPGGFSVQTGQKKFMPRYVPVLVYCF